MQIVNDIYAFLAKGGIMMIPLIASSIMAVAFILERAIQLRRNKVLDPNIIQMIDRIREEKDIDAAEIVCSQKNGAFSNMVKSGLAHRNMDREELKELLEDQGRQEARTLERGLGALETIASAAPLMGLLGTVVGMIKVFNVISQVGVGQASALSGGISEALITTVVGLSIGIPTLVAHNFFMHRAESIILDIEKHLGILMEKIRSLRK